MKGFLVKKSSKETQGLLPSIENKDNGDAGAALKKGFKLEDAFLKMQNVVNQRKNVDITEGDRDVKKHLLKYMNSVPNVNLNLSSGK